MTYGTLTRRARDLLRAIDDDRRFMELIIESVYASHGGEDGMTIVETVLRAASDPLVLIAGVQDLVPVNLALDRDDVVEVVRLQLLLHHDMSVESRMSADAATCELIENAKANLGPFGGLIAMRDLVFTHCVIAFKTGAVPELCPAGAACCGQQSPGHPSHPTSAS